MKRFWLFAFILLIPVQLGRHFWPEWSLVMGLRVDYLAPKIFFLDLIWFLMVVGYRKEFFKKKIEVGIIFLLVTVFVNSLVAEVWQLALLRWLRIFQAGSVLVIISKEREYIVEKLKTIIPYWVLIEGFLALAQVVKGGSLQGIFYFLGERKFTLSTIGIAQMSLGGEELLRAYGTFSHPNSLAGFLMMSLLLWEKVAKKKDFFWWMVWWSGVMGIVLAGSRVIWAFLALYWLYKGWKSFKGTRKRLGMLMIMSGVFLLCFSAMAINYRASDFLGGWDKESISKRWELMVIAFKMWRQNLWFGVGANNFLVRLPEYLNKNGVLWLQPVHNIFLYIVSELGILGSIALGWLIWERKWWRKEGKLLMIGLLVISGLFDHYWFSLWQNWWLALLVLAL